MQHIDIRKKRPSFWPWLAGAAVLALVVWGVSTLLAADPVAEPEVEVPTVEDTSPPAPIPAPPSPPPAGAADGPAVDRPVTIAPTGDDRAGGAGAGKAADGFGYGSAADGPG